MVLGALGKRETDDPYTLCNLDKRDKRRVRTQTAWIVVRAALIGAVVAAIAWAV